MRIQAKEDALDEADNIDIFEGEVFKQTSVFAVLIVPGTSCTAVAVSIVPGTSV